MVTRTTVNVGKTATQLGRAIGTITNALDQQWNLKTERGVSIEDAQAALMQRISSSATLPSFDQVVTSDMVGSLCDVLTAVDRCIRLPLVEKQIAEITGPLQALLMRFHKTAVVIQSTIDSNTIASPTLEVMQKAIDSMKFLTKNVFSILVNMGTLKAGDDRLVDGHYRLLKTLVKFSQRGWKDFGLNDNPAKVMKEYGVPEKIADKYSLTV
jgi:hypothetical protein